MTPEKRRLFVLLGAYEDLTDRESGALRRGDIDYVLAIQERKGRLTEALQTTRRSTELSSDDSAVLRQRVRALEAREAGNLGSLREQMARVRSELNEISQATQRSRKVRRGYTGISMGSHSASESVLGRA
jgi:hypothetical protein